MSFRRLKAETALIRNLNFANLQFQPSSRCCGLCGFVRVHLVMSAKPIVQCSAVNCSFGWLLIEHSKRMCPFTPRMMQLVVSVCHWVNPSAKCHSDCVYPTKLEDQSTVHLSSWLLIDKDLLIEPADIIVLYRVSSFKQRINAFDQKTT